MIFDLAFDLFIETSIWLLGLFPDLPEALDYGFNTFAANVASIVQTVAKFGPILPFGAITIAIGVIFACWIFALAVQAIRWTQSTFTGGGGNV